MKNVKKKKILLILKVSKSSKHQIFASLNWPKHELCQLWKLDDHQISNFCLSILAKTWTLLTLKRTLKDYAHYIIQDHQLNNKILSLFRHFWPVCPKMSEKLNWTIRMWHITILWSLNTRTFSPSAIVVFVGSILKRAST